jgi:DNA-binding NarL/FixJ family response regulator
MAKKKQRNPNATSAQAPASVTARENAKRALELRKGGKSFREVAEKLGVSVSTAYKYVANALGLLAEESTAVAAVVRDEAEERYHRIIQLLESGLWNADGSARPDVDERTAERHVAQLLKTEAARVKLWGADLPPAMQQQMDSAAMDILVALGTDEEIDMVATTGASPMMVLRQVAAVIGRRRKATERRESDDE